MDSRRLYQLWKSLSNEDHPWNTFGCGHKGTLLPLDNDQNVDPAGGQAIENLARTRVMRWWEENYCAGRMKAAILGAGGLDELEELAIRNLHRVPNRQLGPLPTIAEPPWSVDSGSSNLVFVKTIRDTNLLQLRFLLPYQDPLYITAPTRYISNLIGHEGPGSAFNLMKLGGLATALSCGLHSAGRGISMFDIDITLTKDGLANYRRVLAMLFRYIEHLPMALTQSHHFDERRTMIDIGFKYAEKSGSPGTYTKSLAQRMNTPYAREHILSSGVDAWRLDPASIASVISCLTPSRAKAFVAAKDFKEIGDCVGEWKKEKWYGTEYLESHLNHELPVLTTDEDMSLHLPDVNPFVPKNLTVERLEVQTALKAPMKIHESAKSTLWFKKDDQFWRPRGHITVKIQSPTLSDSLSHVVQTRLFVELVTDTLQAPGYAAELAGISYTVSTSLEDIFVSVSGYNDRLQDVLSMILHELLHLKIKEDRFEVAMEKLKRAYDNAYIRQSGEMSDLFLGQVISEKLFAAPERRKELDYITLDNVTSHAKRMFEKARLTILVHGNISQEDAIKTLHVIEDLLPCRSLSSSECISPRALLLPPNADLILKRPVPNINEENSAVSYLCMAGPASHKPTRAILSLLSTMMSEPFFHTMRTIEQLGYNVTCGSWSGWAASGDMGMRFRIQSTQHPEYLEGRIDTFLHAYLATLEAMSSTEFEEHKRGVIDRKRKKLVNLGEENSRFWSHIDDEDLEFERAENDAQIIEGLALNQVIEFFKQHIHPSQTRRKLSVHLVSSRLHINEGGSYATVPQIFEDVSELRGCLKASAAGNLDF